MSEFLDLLRPLYQPELFLSVCLGAAIGLEREIRGKDPSLRTFAFICLGSCLFSMLSKTVAIGYLHGDPGRIAAQIVTGIGFLGAGTIFRSPRGVSGLTTSALMWVTAAIGMAVGFGYDQLALVATLYALLGSLVLNVGHEVFRFFKIGGYSDEALKLQSEGKPTAE